MLVDTDVIIWYMRGDANAKAVLDGSESFTVSAITYVELVQGMRNKRELAALKQGLALWQTEVLHVTPAISVRATAFVEQMFHSHSIELADALIAATAIERGERLLTGNAKHFSKFTGLEVRRFTPAN